MASLINKCCYSKPFVKIHDLNVTPDDFDTPDLHNEKKSIIQSFQELIKHRSLNAGKHMKAVDRYIIKWSDETGISRSTGSTRKSRRMVMIVSTLRITKSIII